MTITVREARVTDAEAIAEIGKVAWLAAYVDPRTGITSQDVLSRNFDAPDRLAKLRERLHADNEEQGTGGRTWVAEVHSTGSGQAEGKVVGFITALNARGAELKAIYILPSYKEQGIGHKLIEPALAWLGNGEVHANVAGTDEHTLAFFKQYKFEETGEKKEVSFPTGKVMTAVVLRRNAQ